MAIINISDSQDKLDVSINNGDLRAISELKELYRFKDKESVIRFALAVLKVGEDGQLVLLKKDGSTKILNPVEDLLENNDSKNEQRGEGSCG